MNNYAAFGNFKGSHRQWLITFGDSIDDVTSRLGYAMSHFDKVDLDCMERVVIKEWQAGTKQWKPAKVLEMKVVKKKCASYKRERGQQQRREATA